MKKNVLTAIAVLVFGFVNAQGVKFGAKVALNIANLTGDIENPSSLTGFQIGGFAEFKLSEKFAFQPELMYSTQGTRKSYSGVIDNYNFSGENKTKLSYLNLPLMLKYYFVPKFNIEFGPQIGLLLSAKNVIDYDDVMDGTAYSGSTKIDIKDQITTVDFGLNFGAGYDFTEKISAGLRYNLGLSTIYDYEIASDPNVKNSVFSISVGYKF